MKRRRRYRCRLCGRLLDEPRTCCGQTAAPADEVRAEHPMERWACPTCGARSDNPMTCCGKPAVRNPDLA